MITYDPARDVTPAFMERVAGWIRQSGEVLVVLRYLGMAGAKDFALCCDRDEFAALVEAAPTGTDIMVFRDQHLPLRGVVDEAFIASALAMIPNGQEYLWITAEVKPGSRISCWGGMGDTHLELRESLEELTGTIVAFGACPDISVADHEGLASAAKGGIDGPR